MLTADNRRVGRWYFGGLAGCCAACFTHPLDLLKVHLQTQQEGKLSLPQTCKKIYKSDGLLGFYNGLSASLLRQLTYTTTRFAVYETVKMQYSEGNLSFIQKMALAGVAGAVGGVAGSPADLINVRMQNDIKLPANQRRNYKNAIDGIIRMSKEEGVAKLFNGCTMATGRAILMTIGQLSFYDQIKQMLIKANLAKDNIYTHLFSSFLAASGATVLTQPMDVLKTRLMNAPPGQFKGLLDCFLYTAKLGPLGFFKGFFPAWVRLAPHTILLFVFFEQFRMRLGYIPEEKLKSIEKEKTNSTVQTSSNNKQKEETNKQKTG
uniref:Mitochondrial dicarboxylate carrier n=1 Tax=Meloidogyne incognita TaxID=6306 RepID=A0A914KIS3_MELIC